MANRIGFKEFLKNVKQNQEVQLIVDANVIIASKDKNHKQYGSIGAFLKELDSITQRVTLFTTVTTKAEFLDYYRRKILTEGILELYKKNKVTKMISNTVKQEIEKQVRLRSIRQAKEVQAQEKMERILEGHDIDTTEFDISEFSIDANYFKDSENKAIKKSFRARNVLNEEGWLQFCNAILLDRLHTLEKLLDELCHYLTTRDEVSLKYFINKDVSWRMATQICGETGMGYSDAMIINMANHTSIEHIITFDFDVIYGGHVSAKDKTFITPTDRLKDYKNILKGI